MIPIIRPMNLSSLRRAGDEASMRVTMSLSGKVGLAGIVLVAAATYAVAQMTPDQHSMPAAMPPGMSMGHAGLAAGQPTLPGQDAFGAIQEIVGILDADPNTDW